MSRPTLEDLLVADEDEATVPVAPVSLKRRYLGGHLLPGPALARRILWNACPTKLQCDIERGRSLVIVVETTDDWIDLMHEAARDLIRSADFFLNKAAKATKSLDLQEASLRTATSTGRSVVIVTSLGTTGVSDDILSAADYHITTKPADRQIIASALRTVFRMTRTPKLPAEITTIRAASALIAAIRPGENAARAIKRLSAIAQRNLASTPAHSQGPTLNELFGYGTAKDWGLELARDLEAFRAGQIPWSAISSAAILHGAPGVGKTFFAAALARTCNAPLVTTSLGRIFGSTPGYLDSIVKGLSSAFTDARTQAPAVLFIDELDALPDRKTLEGRGRDWWATVCNHFLKLLDESRDKVIVLAATNMIDRIDEAILRPGRIDRHFEILPPTETELFEIFRHHIGSALPDADLAVAARLAQGTTGAGVELIVKSARANARREDRPLILGDLVRQIAPAARDPSMLERISIHEAGHALAAHLLGRTVEYVSTLSSSGYGGIAMIEQMGQLVTRKRIEDQVVINLAGRNAELILLGEASSGAHSDLDGATRFIAALHGSFGLGDSVMQRAHASVASTMLKDSEFRNLVEAELQRLDARCRELLQAHHDQLIRIAEILQSQRVMSGNELRNLVSPT